MSEGQTVGAFLQEKLGNMAKWVDHEVGKENLSVDIIAGIAGRSELEATVLGSVLRSNKEMVDQRNWSGLGYLARQHLPELEEVIGAINQRERLHAKFWRYMDLFVEVMGS